MPGEGNMKGKWCESVGWGSARGPGLSASLLDLPPGASTPRSFTFSKTFS